VTKNERDKTDENYDQLWKMRAIFDSAIIHMLNITYQPKI